MNRHKLLTIAVVGWLGMMLTTETGASEFVPPLADGTFPEQDDYRLLVGISYEF